MQAASNYAADASAHMEHAIRQMPVIAVPTLRRFTSTPQEISRYVEQLLTPEQQRACDMATD